MKYNPKVISIINISKYYTIPAFFSASLAIGDNLLYLLVLLDLNKIIILCKQAGLYFLDKKSGIYFLKKGVVFITH